MTHEEFFERNRELPNWSREDQYLAWAWYLTTFQGKEEFLNEDIAQCYRCLQLPAPDFIKGQGSELWRAKKLLPSEPRRFNCYRLERLTREALDQKFARRPEPKEHVETLELRENLEDSQKELTEPSEKLYLNEAITCLKHGAFRAAVVMGWNLAYDHPCHYVL